MDGTRDGPLSDARGEPRRGPRIAGATRHAGLMVPYDRGVMTEMLRPEWDTSGAPVLHVSQVRLFPGVISAWHRHDHTTDRVFASQGHLKIVLFDDRPDSLTRGEVDELYAGEARPVLLVVPPGVWHGIQNVGSGDGFYVNFASHPYDYDRPDHSRLPYDSPDVPYRWDAGLTPVRPAGRSG